MEVLIPCEAQCHALGASVDSDEDCVYLSFFIGSFYAGQESLFSRWRRRLGIAFTVLCGNDYRFEDIVLSRENAINLAKTWMPTHKKEETPPAVREVS